MRGTRVLLASTALLATAAGSWAQPPEANPADGTPSAAPAEVEIAALSPRRDPFRPFTLDIHPTESQVPLTPLQRYELGQLIVVGTVWAVNPPRAMLEDSSGMGYIVTLGTPIGRNSGVVTAIEPERVVVEERILDYYGKEQVNRVVMETPKDDPNQPAQERK